MSAFTRTWNSIRRLWASDVTEANLESTLQALRAKQPVPVFWLFGKTQSGKSSIVRYLTGSTADIVGRGFRPCTATTLRYPFPVADAPVLEFLDTRGLDDPSYEPAADTVAFHSTAQVMIVTAKITDFAQVNVITALRAVRRDNPKRRVVLVLTCLHEALNGVLHSSPDAPAILNRMASQHHTAFEGLFDTSLMIDFTRKEEGFPEPHWNGTELKETLLNQLPMAYRQCFEQNLEAVKLLKDLHQDQAGPIIAGYAALAASAAAMPVPFVDLVLFPAIQARMVFALAKVYNQELSTVRFLELAGSLGIGLLARQAVREAAKLVPFLGSAVAATTAFASTYAFGKAFGLYFEQVHEGHMPDADTLKSLYAEQFAAARQRWIPKR